MCACVWVFECVRACVRVSVHTHTGFRVYVYTQRWVYLSLLYEPSFSPPPCCSPFGSDSLRTCEHTNTKTHKHTHTHTHTHTSTGTHDSLATHAPTHFATLRISRRRKYSPIEMQRGGQMQLTPLPFLVARPSRVETCARIGSTRLSKGLVSFQFGFDSGSAHLETFWRCRRRRGLPSQDSASQFGAPRPCPCSPSNERENGACAHTMGARRSLGNAQPQRSKKHAKFGGRKESTVAAPLPPRRRN